MFPCVTDENTAAVAPETTPTPDSCIGIGGTDLRILSRFHLMIDSLANAVDQAISSLLRLLHLDQWVGRAKDSLRLQQGVKR